MRKKRSFLILSAALSAALILAGCGAKPPRRVDCRKSAPFAYALRPGKVLPPQLPRYGAGTEPGASPVPENVTETVPCAGSYTATIRRSGSQSGGGVDYTVTQMMDGTTFIVSARSSGEWTYSLFLLREDGGILQTIAEELHSTEDVGFLDVNLDGCADIQLYTGGTLNETHDLYLWDTASQTYVKVLCDEMLSYFEVYGGYLKNWIKESAASGWYQELYWEDNTLVKRVEEYYRLDG